MQNICIVWMVHGEVPWFQTVPLKHCVVKKNKLSAGLIEAFENQTKQDSRIYQFERPTSQVDLLGV